MNKKRKYKTEIGTIHLVNLENRQGHLVRKLRPCLVVDNDRETVTVYPITSNNKELHRTEVSIPKGIGNLEYDSKIKMGQVISINRNQCIKLIGVLPIEYISNVIDYIMTRGIIKKLGVLVNNKVRSLDNTINNNLDNKAA